MAWCVGVSMMGAVDEVSGVVACSVNVVKGFRALLALVRIFICGG